jgi:hypothetical protein
MARDRSVGIPPLVFTPLQLRSGSFGLGRNDRVWGGLGKDDSIEGVPCSQPRNYLLFESTNANIRRLFTVFYGPYAEWAPTLEKRVIGNPKTLPLMNTDEVELVQITIK